MRLGTTPIHQFIIPFEVSMIQEFKVTYSQRDKIILEKYLEDFQTDEDENSLSITLTQEETFLFTSGIDVDVQARVLTIGNEALASDIYCISASRCLDSEVLE